MAHDGRKALVQLGEAHPQAVVLDIMTPVHGGFEVLRRMRGSVKYANTRVVMLTARHGEANVIGALELGADEYLLKPFLPEELLARLARLKTAPFDGR